MICTRDFRHWLIAAAVTALAPAASAAPGGEWLPEIEAAVARGDGVAAEAAVERALEAGVARPQVAAFAGEAELLQGNLAHARTWLAPGRFASASRERGFRALARLEIHEGDFVAAAAALDRALADSAGSAALWVEIGRLRYRVGQHHSALAAAIRAVDAGPSDPQALLFRGQLARDAGGPVAALPWFERAAERAPEDVDLLGEYAATLGDAGRNTDMLRVARRMVELDPGHPQPYFLQAILAARAGHDALARRLLDRTGGAYQKMPAAQMLGGMLELRIGSPALAVAEFEALTRRQPDNATAALLLGRALLANGEASEVVVRLGPVAERAEASPYLLALVGRAYEQMGRRAEAARFLDRAGGPRPAIVAVLPARAESGTAPGDSSADAEATVASLRALLAQGRRAEALAAVERMRRRHAGSADVERIAGDAALLAGDPQAALTDYARAMQIRRDFALVERTVAALRMTGREDAARGLLADYIAGNPRSAAAAALLGRMLAQGGQAADGAALMNLARNLNGTRDPRLLADLAGIELALGRLEKAERSARHAYALQRANGRAAQVLARVAHAREVDGPETIALLSKARQSAGPLELARR